MKVALALIALTVGMTTMGCFASGDGDSPPDEEEVGKISEGIAAAGCHRYDTIYPQTRDQDRWIIDRALSWVDDHVMYSQTETHDGWRKDCSGFVSMSWKLVNTKPGLVTWTIDERAHDIAWHDLRPGDALLVPHHHVFLFAGWANHAHTEMCAIEEYDYGHPASITKRSRADVEASGYQPIRRDHD